MPDPHQIVVVGGSAGGVHAVSELLAALPEDLPAAVFVTLHLPPHSRGPVDVLDQAGPLPVRFASEGDPIVGGQVLVAPPDHHLLLLDGHVTLGRGPRENRNRPAIDPLFRSAARSFGRGVAAVVVSGGLSDGAAGLLAVEAAGGTALVQSPEEALVGDMPRAAIELDGPELVASMSELAKVIVDRAGPPPPPGEHPLHRVAHHAEDGQALLEPDAFGPLPDATPSAFSCPECGGVLWDLAEPTPRLRCRVGHAYVADDLWVEQQLTVEGALWTAVRALEEQADLAARLAKRAADSGQALVEDRFDQRRDDARSAAVVLIDFLREAPWMAD